MKVCERCGEQLPDNATQCSRCGSFEISGGRQNQSTYPAQRNQVINNGGPQQRPQGGPRPQGGLRPQGGPQQRPQGGPRPQGAPQQRPTNGPQQRPQGAPRPQGGPQQRPQGGPKPQGGPQQRPQAMGNPNQYNGNGYDEFNNGYGESYDGQPVNTQEMPVQNQDNVFDTGKKKKGKKEKAPKQPKQPKAPKEPKQPKEKVIVDNSEYGREITFKEWFIYLIQFCIPIWGIIHTIKTLASTPSLPKTMTNMGKAYIVVNLIVAVITVIISFLMLSTIGMMIVNLIPY